MKTEALVIDADATYPRAADLWADYLEEKYRRARFGSASARTATNISRSTERRSAMVRNGSSEPSAGWVAGRGSAAAARAIYRRGQGGSVAL